MKQLMENESTQISGGPLHYFGNRSLSLPGFDGRMKVDPSWIEQGIEIIQANLHGMKFKRCFEPFAGSAAWSLSAMRNQLAQEYIINDCNQVLIGFFINVQKNPSLVKETYQDLVEKFDQASNKDSFFKQIMERYNFSTDFQRSLIMPFIINHSWGGMVFHDHVGRIIYREPVVNGKKIPGFLDKATLSLSQFFEEIDEVSILFNINKVHFRCQDFEEVLQDVRADDFVNLNPPYPENERSISEQYGLYFEIYSRETLHQNICNALKRMHSLKVTYFMSYGLYSPEMQDFLVHDSSSKVHNRYLRLIGFDDCIFGRWLDQWYFSENIIIPDLLRSKVIPASQFAQCPALSPQEALSKYLDLSKPRN